MKLATVTYEPGDAKTIDDLLRDLATALKSRGLRVAGAVQRNDVTATNACANMVIEDIKTGRAFDISVPGEKKVDTCSLDPAALEDAAGYVAATLDDATDLVIINRFGKQEALGNGFRSVVEQAIGAEKPVLIALCSTHRSLWDEFSGGHDERLAAHSANLLQWCLDAAGALEPFDA